MAPQSAFSFHCMICFEEFHPDERYPVVLPCGHTYVCNMCGDRLDKCMECRVPLYMTVPRPLANNPPNANSTRNTPSYRSHRHVPPTPPSPPVPPLKKRLPLPKNVVLLSLIEATELATEDASSKPEASPQPIKTTNSNSMGSLDGGSARSLDGGSEYLSASIAINPEEVEEERIRLGTSMAVSVAGTYAVTDEAGLPIFTHRPSRSKRHTATSAEESSASRESSGKQTSTEDVDKLVRHFHLDHKIETDESTAEEDELKENRIKEQPPMSLSCGDRVQVVAIEGRWAKLARGYGYVRADGNKLVKVGNTVDRSCKLEAMLRSLSTQRKQLRLEQSKVDNMFIRLMNDLQVSLMTDEDLTVIVADTFANAENEKEKILQRQQDEARDKEPITRGVAPRLARISSIEEPEETGPIKPPAFRVQNQPQEQRQDPPGMPPSAVSNAASGFACFANDMFDSISCTASTDETEFQKMRRQQGLATPNPRATTTSIDANPATLFPSASHPSPSAMSAGARAWREMHGRQEPSSAIDFKTGMSGHMALLSSHAHPHEYLGARLPSFHGMSNHSGLSITKPIKKTVGALYQSMYQSLYPALNVPSLSGGSVGTPERPHHVEDSRSDRSDSM